jgi:hypothetical protein
VDTNVLLRPRRPHELMVCLGAAARAGDRPAWAREVAARLVELEGVEPEVVALARRAADGEPGPWAARSPY